MHIAKIGISILTLSLIISHASAADVTVTPSSKIVIQGQTFNLNVSVDPKGVAIAGAQLNIAFNKSILNVNSITEGNLFKQNGSRTIFDEGTIDNSLGTVVNIYGAIKNTSGVPKNVLTPGTFIIISATAAGSSGTSGINLVNVKVVDPSGNPITLNVINGSVTINPPPILTPIGNKIVNENQTLTFTISATDEIGSPLVYSASNLPSGATFDPGTQTFQWTPDFTQAGVYPDVHFEVSDGTLTAFENITITVINVNRAPTFTSILPANNSIFKETDSIQINVIASDPDNDPLNYTIEIDGVQVSTSASYTWTKDYKDYPVSGNHSINISIDDGTVSVSSTITIYINVYRYDVNKDGVVDVGDISITGQHFGELTTEPYPRYDIDMSGEVDVADIVIAGQHFSENT